MTWRAHASCLDRPDLLPVWMGEDHDPSRVFDAKRTCWGCPSIEACEADMLAGFDAEHAAGVIAGKSEVDRKGRRGRPYKPRTPILCGTRAGYHRHRKQGEDSCDPCRQANTDYSRVWKREAS